MAPLVVEKLVLGCTHHGGDIALPASGFVETFPHLAEVKSDPQRARQAIAQLVAFNYTPKWIAAHPREFEGLVVRSLRYKRPGSAISRQLGAISHFDVSEQVQSIRVPTLIVHGDNDLVVPYENGLSIHKKISGSKLVTLRDIGHVFWDMDGGQAAQAIRDFLGTQANESGQLISRL